jgi:hypothetical protein
MRKIVIIFPSCNIVYLSFEIEDILLHLTYFHAPCVVGIVLGVSQSCHFGLEI